MESNPCCLNDWYGNSVHHDSVHHDSGHHDCGRHDSGHHDSGHDCNYIRTVHPENTGSYYAVFEEKPE